MTCARLPRIELAASCAAPLSATQPTQGRNRDVNDPPVGHASVVRTRFRGRSRLGSERRCLGMNWAGFCLRCHPSRGVSARTNTCRFEALTRRRSLQWLHAKHVARDDSKTLPNHVDQLRTPLGRWEAGSVQDWQQKRLPDAELRALFDRLFPHGFAARDVLDEIAPDGWERSPLLACFHPSIERLLEERLLMHRHLEELRRMRHSRSGETSRALQPEPTLEDARRDYEPRPVQCDEEVTELVGMCLWDIFSDNHEVITADGRSAGLGSFRGSSAFLDEYLNPDGGSWREGDAMRFYMGTLFVRNRRTWHPYTR